MKIKDFNFILVLIIVIFLFIIIPIKFYQLFEKLRPCDLSELYDLTYNTHT